MDPEATLKLAQEAIDNHDWEEALYLLADYRAWRSDGGFQPRGGDAEGDWLAREIPPIVIARKR